MATLDQMVPRIFRHAWRRYGKPFMTVVRQISEWSLPIGFSYDETVDAIRNTSGTVLLNHADYWVTDVVYIVPVQSSAYDRAAELRDLLVNGVVDIGGIEVFVLGSDIDKLRKAHLIVLGNQWYNLDNQQPEPSGYPSSDGIWARVRLRGRT